MTKSMRLCSAVSFTLSLFLAALEAPGASAVVVMTRMSDVAPLVTAAPAFTSPAQSSPRHSPHQCNCEENSSIHPQNALSILSDALKMSLYPSSHSEAPKNHPRSAGPAQNALSVLSDALKTFSHPSPTQKPHPVLQGLPASLISSIAHEGNEAASLKAEATIKAHGWRCCPLLGGFMDENHNAEFTSFTPNWIPCDQCKDRPSCCIDGPERDGFVSCTGREVSD